MLCERIITDTIRDLTDEEHVNVLIIDDSMFERASSKKVEMLSKVYDYAKKTYKYGFHLLTLGWSDGNTFLPVMEAFIVDLPKKLSECLTLYE